MSHKSIRVQLADTINEFTQENHLADASSCEEDRLNGMHARLIIGGANGIIDQILNTIYKALEAEAVTTVKGLKLVPLSKIKELCFGGQNED